MQSSSAQKSRSVPPNADVVPGRSLATVFSRSSPMSRGEDPSNSPTPAPLPALRLIPLQSVCYIVGLKRSAVLDKVSKGELPAPIKFGTSRRAAVRWIEQEIVDYVWAKAAERTKPALPAHRGEAPGAGI